MTAVVQFFGRRHHERRRVLRRPAYKKRQGTKSPGGLGGGRGGPALWRFDYRAGYEGGREAGARRPGQGAERGLEARNTDLGGGVECINGRSVRWTGVAQRLNCERRDLSPRVRGTGVRAFIVPMPRAARGTASKTGPREGRQSRGRQHLRGHARHPCAHPRPRHHRDSGLRLTSGLIRRVLFRSS